MGSFVFSDVDIHFVSVNNVQIIIVFPSVRQSIKTYFTTIDPFSQFVTAFRCLNFVITKVNSVANDQSIDNIMMLSTMISTSRIAHYRYFRVQTFLFYSFSVARCRRQSTLLRVQHSADERSLQRYEQPERMRTGNGHMPDDRCLLWCLLIYFDLSRISLLNWSFYPKKNYDGCGSRGTVRIPDPLNPMLSFFFQLQPTSVQGSACWTRYPDPSPKMHFTH